MNERLQPTLSLLDEGLSLYRRNFGGFMLITASWFVPVAIITGLLVAAISWMDELQATLISLGAALVMLPLLVYLVGGLSRATIDAVEGRAIGLRHALAINPIRAAGMGCFTLIYSIIMQVVGTMMSIICICPLYLFSIMAFAALFGIADYGLASTVLGTTIAIVFLAGIYLFIVFVGGAGYSSLIYALQPWTQDSRPFGVALQLSFELIGYKFLRNVVVWGLSALVLSAAGLTATITVGVLIPLPVLFVLGEESPIAQAVAATAWLIGLIVVIPPLPIWMALHFRRNLAARAGEELNTQIQSWWQAHFAAPEQSNDEQPTEIADSR